MARKIKNPAGTFRKTSPSKAWIVAEYERVTGLSAAWVNERCAAADAANATLAWLITAEKQRLKGATA